MDRASNQVFNTQSFLLIVKIAKFHFHSQTISTQISRKCTILYSQSLRSATHDLRSQSEFLFTSHVFKSPTYTQLQFHWIERGNVSRVTIITSNYVIKQLKRDGFELCDVKVYYNIVFQNLVFKLNCINKTNTSKCRKL